MIDGALILAGGRGTRMAPWSAPKCLMPINGVPILYRIIDHVSRYVRDVSVCVGYRGDDVRAALRGRTHECSVRLSDAGIDAPMGARLIKARSEFKPETVGLLRFLICYGDTLADVDIMDIFRHHDARGAAATFVAVHERIPFGVVSEENRRIDDGSRALMNIGFAIVEPRCWQWLDKGHGVSDWLNEIARHAPVECYVHEGRHATINSLADAARAEELLR